MVDGPQAPALRDQPAAPSSGPRRRRAVVAGAAVAVLVAAGGAAAALGVFRAEPPAPPPAVVVLPSPTPTVAPVERASRSAFADALPSSVLTFALTGMVEEAPLLLAGALEGYRLEYADGAGGTVTVLASQWPTPADATDAAERVAPADAGTVDDGRPTSGDVTVAGEPVGAWSIVAAEAGAAVLTWTNGTALLQVTGPTEVVRDVHAAYPY